VASSRDWRRISPIGVGDTFIDSMTSGDAPIALAAIFGKWTPMEPSSAA
jgi:hypothetical protein